MTDTGKPLTPKIIAALAAVYFIWGSTYLAIKVTLEDLTPFLEVLTHHDGGKNQQRKDHRQDKQDEVGPESQSGIAIFLQTNRQGATPPVTSLSG